MPRRPRPGQTERSEHWMRVAVNECTEALNARIAELFGWGSGESIHWLSPVVEDEYAEYFDGEFLQRLGLPPLAVSLSTFWPASGPRWDGLAKTSSGKILLVEAKAYVEEAVDYRSHAGSESLGRIHAALAEAKQAFGAALDAPWPSPFYQYANRLAHLYFLRERNGLDAYLLFLNCADAPDVPEPCSVEQWRGANRLVKKCLGLGAHPYRDRVGTMIWSVPEMLTQQGRRS